MRRAEEYVRIAKRQRRIAATLPFSSFRQRFLTSAERFDALAKASGEFGTPDTEDD